MSKNYDFTFAQREEGFDDHIEHSIRGYTNLLDDIVSLSRNFVEDETNVIDIGCSTGKLTEAFVKSNQNLKLMKTNKSIKQINQFCIK